MAFGFAVAISGDRTRLVVGAKDDHPDGIASGSARIYGRDGVGWTEEDVLVGANLEGAGSDELGNAVAMSFDGSRVIIGARGDDIVGGAGTDAGSARVFARSGTVWSEEAILTMPMGVAYHAFGTSVAMSADGSRVTVGDPGLSFGGGLNSVCGAQVFDRTGTTWAPGALILSASYQGGQFAGLGGIALSADGTRTAVGIPEDGLSGGPDGTGTVRVRRAAVARGVSAWERDGGAMKPNRSPRIQRATDARRSGFGAAVRARK